MAQSSLKRFLCGFASDTRGVVSLEFALMMPLLFWALGAMAVFFDGYRQSTVNLKAAYTISDVVSRETNGVDDDYVDTLKSLYDFLTRKGSGNSIRVTVVGWDGAQNKYVVDWSAKRGMDDAITNDNLDLIQSRLPVLSDGDRIIVVETNTLYEPNFKIGLGDKVLSNFVVTRPRFAPLVAWTG